MPRDAFSDNSDDRDDEIEIDLGQVLSRLNKHKHTIISSIIIFSSLSLLYSYRATPIFKSVSRILVEGSAPKIVKVEDVIIPDYTDRANYFNSQIEVLKSHTLANVVFEEIKGYEPWDRRVKPASELKEITKEERIDSLLKKIRVSSVRQTNVIEISVEDPDPELAARIANSLTKNFIMFSSSDQLIQRKKELEDDMRQQLKYLKGKHPVIIGLRSEIDAIDKKLDEERQKLAAPDPLTGLSSAVQNRAKTSNVKIIDQASVAKLPVRPNKVLNLALAVFLGIFFGTGMAFIFESLDQTIKTPDDIEHILGSHSLISIPFYVSEMKRRDAPPPQLIAAYDNHSLVAEAFRSLRTSVIYSSPDFKKQTILVTSPGPSEGKTTVALNLAIVFAQSDDKTIIIDADLRYPKIHSFFNIEKERGLTELLATKLDDINSFIHKTDIPNLHIMTCGVMSHNPSELLGSKKMQELLNKLSLQYDRIIFDTPPLLAASDAVVLSTKANASIIVIKSGDTHRMAALRSIKMISAVHGHILGVALNMMKQKDYAGYYYYHYNYGKNKKKDRPARHRVKSSAEPLNPRAMKSQEGREPEGSSGKS